MYEVQQIDIDILKQRAKTIYTKIELLNNEMLVMDEIQGAFIDGGISIDSGSDIRRTFDGTILVKDDTYITSETSRIWLDKKIRVYIGFLYQRTQEIHWYSLGVFNFCDNSFNYDEKTKELKVSCLDLMSSLNGDLGGVLIGSETKIPIDSKIRDAMVKTVTQLGGISKYRITYQSDVVPYDMSWGTGATVWEILEELRDLYYSYEMFFDEDTFVCQRVPMDSGEPVVMSNELFDQFVLSEGMSNSFSEVKNVIEVWGETTKANYYSEETTYENGVYTFKLKGAQIKDNKKFSFLAPATNPEGCKIKIINNEAQEDGSDKDVEYGPYTLYRSSVDDTGEDVLIDSGIMEADKYYVVKLKKERFYFVGQTQIHAMAKLVDKLPTSEEAAKDKEKYACDNIGYVVNPESPFTVSKIGEINKVCEGGDFAKIYTDELALQRAEYELYVSSRLTDSVSVECILIPWLDVNNKVGYTSKNSKTHRAEQYMINNISFDIGNGTMKIKMSHFYPYYPNTVQLVPTETDES